MEQLDLFTDKTSYTTQVLFVNFGKSEEKYCLPLLAGLREAGINTEIYPDQGKMKKQLNYANRKNVKYVALVGESEIEEGVVTLKNMETGQQDIIKTDVLVDYLIRQL